MKFIFTGISFLLVLLSFGQTKLSNTEAFKIIDKSKVQVLDVRTAEEFSKGHLKNSININWNDRDNFEKATNTNLDKNNPVYVYCLSGGRSSKAAQYLVEQGYEVFEIDGGMMKWEAANLPIVSLNNKSASLSFDDYKSLTRSHPKVLINFSADWCAPCREMAPIIDKIAENYKDKVKVIKIDADENKTLLKQLGITSIPQLLVFKNGKKIWSKSGLVDINTLEKKLN
ncbi:thioredoxin domain-containing protein [Sphingobacterium composti Ten et al. 2007 non Yoo et al. 2007]|uniref:thioredoxin domain-containing protein n=1 Tax=Sphingobacterium composti TaxID=363260 RepID=UPI00135B51A2|nr:thioredoxin domain-containing protein [Sphingobacterium composti Ten et al. 2007 non Yoo et al. 2007]